MLSAYAFAAAGRPSLPSVGGAPAAFPDGKGRRSAEDRGKLPADRHAFQSSSRPVLGQFRRMLWGDKSASPPAGRNGGNATAGAEGTTALEEGFRVDLQAIGPPSEASAKGSSPRKGAGRTSQSRSEAVDGGPSSKGTGKCEGPEVSNGGGAVPIAVNSGGREGLLCCWAGAIVTTLDDRPRAQTQRCGIRGWPTPFVLVLNKPGVEAPLASRVKDVHYKERENFSESSRIRRVRFENYQSVIEYDAHLIIFVSS